jgi:hypothetical protein
MQGKEVKEPRSNLTHSSGLLQEKLKAVLFCDAKFLHLFLGGTQSEDLT